MKRSEQYENFILHFHHYYEYNKAWCRKGQALMNVLAEFQYGKYLEIIKNGIDCYDNEENVTKCLEFLKEGLGD